MTIHPPEQIDLGNVVLRRHRVEDAEAIAEAVGESLDELLPWMPWAAPPAATVDVQRARLVDNMPAWDEGSEYSYVLLAPSGEDQPVLGVISLMRRIGTGALEIGYWVRTGFTGQGLATAAAGALTEAALELPDIDRVEIHCDEANTRSRVIPERLGYRLDRVVDDGIEAPGETGRGMIWILDRANADAGPP